MCVVFVSRWCSGVIVSVGIFRVFGSELAELPLVATSRDCQGQVISFVVEPRIPVPCVCFKWVKKVGMMIMYYDLTG